LATALFGDVMAAQFVDEKACQGCHQPEYKDWLASHHEHAMQRAGPGKVLGDFDNVTFSHRGETTRFFRKDDRYYAVMRGQEGVKGEHEIKYTFGVEPLQQYLVEMPNGELQALTVAWDTVKRRWFSIYPDQDIQPGDALHWTGVYLNWNAMCAECHSTNLRTGFDADSQAHQTTFSRADVGCQACHGPGSGHVAWAGKSPGERRGSKPHKGLVVDFSGKNGRFEVEQCARCHSRRERISENDAHGRQFMDDFLPATLREGLYHPDGQIDDEVYVYGSFVQSKMFAAGVKCTDCHQPHSLQLYASGDALCMRCHQQSPDLRFPTLQARQYDSSAHHFHPPGSEGARCVSCHMPGQHYMVVDHRRDHSFRVPRPDLSARLNAPDACTGCHSDRNANWASAQIEKRYGKHSRDPHYGEAIAAGRRGQSEAGAMLSALALDTAQPAIVRASALELLGPYGQAGAMALSLGLSDPDPLVRVGALRGIRPLPARVRVAGALKVIGDPVRAVRIEAARLLTGFPPGDLQPALARELATAGTERDVAARANGNLPAGQLGLGILAQARSEPWVAESHYQKALKMDRHFHPARLNLANLLNREGRNPDARTVLEAGVTLAPAQGELRYSLALLLAEMGDLAGAVSQFEAAARLMPLRSRVHYNLGLALAQLGKNGPAGKALLKAYQIDPTDTDVIYGLVSHYDSQQDWQRAEDFAERLVRQNPSSRQARQLVTRYRTLIQYGKKKR
jgi:predicted CXXCH cytochrome family protein